jgi:SNF2 family DNA or RNA helicase
MNLNNFLPYLGIPDQVKVTLEPRQYQVQDAEYFLCCPQRSANYSEVGTGKSLTSYLYIMGKLFQGKGVLVIMPPGLIYQYMENFKVIEGHLFTFAKLHHDRTKRHKEMYRWDIEGWPDCLFLSYAMFVKYASALRQIQRYSVIVADEAHSISNVTTQGFAAVYSFIQKVQGDLHLMTATPTPTELQGAYGQIKLKTPGAYSSLDQFDRMHVEYAHKQIMVVGKDGRERPHKVQTIVGYKAVDALQENLMALAIRRRQKEVLPMDDVTIVDHQLCLTGKHEELYTRLMAERLLELGDEILVAKNASALRQMALQIITNPNKFVEQGKEFTPAEIEPLVTLLALIASMPLKETKLIIFCHFTATVEMLAKVLAQYNPALVYGGSDTQKNVDKLLKDDTCRIGILNFASGGAGFNLQSVCHQAIVYEAIGSPGTIQQGIGRIHRSGQQHPVVVWMLRYCLSLSSKLMNKAFMRAGDIKESLGDDTSWVDFVVTGVDILD